MKSGRATTLRWLAAACAAVGLIVTIVLMVLATSRPRQHVELMARAPVGCTTTLEFQHAGTYYVWEESSTHAAPALEGDCEPASTGGTFHVEFVDQPGSPAVQESSMSNAPTYSVDGYSAVRAVTAIVVSEGSTVDVAVYGPDSNVNASIGRDPQQGVVGLSVASVLAFLAGVGGMILLLVLAHQASKRVAAAAAGVAPAGYAPYGQAPPQPYHPYQPGGYQHGTYQAPYQAAPPQSAPTQPGMYQPPSPYPQAGMHQSPSPYQRPGTNQPSGPYSQPGVYQSNPTEGYLGQQAYPPVAPPPGQLLPPPTPTPEQSNWNAPAPAPAPEQSDPS